ncbi:MAG: hypothetical protein V1837_03535 [Candidatus Woesearchaeota archaeon]
MIVCANLTKNIELGLLFSQISSIGFKHAQFSFVHYGINEQNPSLDNSFPDKARQMKENAARYKLDFPVVHGWLPTAKNESINTLAVYLEVKEILSSKYLIIHPKDHDNLVSIVELIKMQTSSDSIIVENAAETNFKMGVKEIGMVLNSGINLCFDTCHALESGLNIDDFLKEIGKHIKVIHLSDFDGTKRHMVIGTKITEPFVKKIPEDVIIVFEHKAQTPSEYHDAYAESLNRFNEMLKHPR